MATSNTNDCPPGTRKKIRRKTSQKIITHKKPKKQTSVFSAFKVLKKALEFPEVTAPAESTQLA